MALIRRTGRRAPAVLYHGTLQRHLPSILRDGLQLHVGWAGFEQTGVFLTTSHEYALEWAKLRALHTQQEEGGDLSAELRNYERLPLDEQDAVVLTVDVTGLTLEPDREQAEDGGLDPYDITLAESIEHLGSAVATEVLAPWRLR